MLITGASGFLGSHVVAHCLARGHSVRAVVRPGGRRPPGDWQGRVEIAHADLQTSPQLENLFDGVDVLIHLAASMQGTLEAQRSGTALGTERMLEAMHLAGSTHNVVLASSFSVYSWATAKTVMDENSPLESNIYDRDAYAVAKILQERVTRELAQKYQWRLAVLRPGFIYGPGARPAASAGLRIGPLFLVFAPTARLRLTHVQNCASAFVNAAEQNASGTFNIIDDDRVTAWLYAGRLNRHQNCLMIPIPYPAGLAFAYITRFVGRLLPARISRRLPRLLDPLEYRIRFKSLVYENRYAKENLGWKCQPLFEGGRDII